MGRPLDWSGITLGCLYTMLCLVVVLQITRILIGRHSILRFQFGFLLLCFLWTIFRVIFWFNTANWSSEATEFIYWIPIWVQFATFSLLVLFYCSVLFKYSWDHHICCCKFLQTEVAPIPPKQAPWTHCQRRQIFFLVYLIINFCFFGLFTAWIIAQAEAPQLALSKMGSILSGVLFLFLMAILVFYAREMSLMVRDTISDNPLNKVPVLKGQINNRMVFFSYLIAVIFTIRSIYDFVSSFNESIRDWGSIYNNSVGVAPFGFAMFILWEIIPTGMILLQFRKIPNSSDRRKVPDMPQDSIGRIPFGRPAKDLPEVGAPSSTRSKRFSDVRRYDSDEESGANGASVNSSVPNHSYGTPGDTFSLYSFSPQHSTSHSQKSRFLPPHGHS